VLCVRARQMHQRARSGASHGCKWDQHGIFNCFYVNWSTGGVPSARWGLEKVGRRNEEEAERRTAKRVDLHGHDHEERGEGGLLVAGHRAPRRAISPWPRTGRTGHPPEQRGMGAAGEQAKGRGGGGGGCSAPTACMQARAGRNCILSSLLATSADTVEGAVSAKSRTTSADSPCSLRRSSHRAVRCSSALKRIRTLAWSRLWDEAVRNRCAEVVEIARLCARARRRPPEDEDGAFLWDGHQTSSVTSPRTR